MYHTAFFVKLYLYKNIQNLILYRKPPHTKSHTKLIVMDKVELKITPLLPQKLF